LKKRYIELHKFHGNIWPLIGKYFLSFLPVCCAYILAKYGGEVFKLLDRSEDHIITLPGPEFDRQYQLSGLNNYRFQALSDSFVLKRN
jgi:hypothetical protein